MRVIFKLFKIENTCYLYSDMVTGSMDLNNKQSWLLLIIDSASYVDGDTRLQKYGLIASKSILENSMYDDWKPHHYGAYSTLINRDMQLFKKDGLVNVYNIRGHNVYTLSEKGKKAIQSFKDRCLDKHRGKVEKIKQFLGNYQGKPLEILLGDTYRQYPEYVDKSRIKDQIHNGILKNSLGDFNSNGGTSTQAITSARPGQFPYGDEEFRKKLAKEIGLDEPPQLDKRAYDEFGKLFADRILHDDALDEIKH